MPLFAKGGDVPRGPVAMQVSGGMLATQQVVGTNASLMIAERSGGYHSNPHVHDCEQLNYMIQGEVWIFIQDQAFHLRPGDFLRIPANIVHWAWNCTDEPCILAEAHLPALDVLPRGQAILLLDETEDAGLVRWVESQFVTHDQSRAEAQGMRKGDTLGGGTA